MHLEYDFLHIRLNHLVPWHPFAARNGIRCFQGNRDHIVSFVRGKANIGGSGADRFDGGAGDDSMVGGANGRDAWGNPGMDIVNYNGSVSRFTIEYSTDGKTWSAKNPGAGDLVVRVSDSLADADGGVGVDILTGMEALSFNDKWISLQTTRSAVDVDGDGKPDQIQIIGTASADTLVGDTTNDH